MTPAQKQWIDNASYKELLGKYRYAPLGDPMFHDEDGQYFIAVMYAKRDELTAEEVVQTSKQIGWDR